MVNDVSDVYEAEEGVDWPCGDPSFDSQEDAQRFVDSVASVLAASPPVKIMLSFEDFAIDIDRIDDTCDANVNWPIVSPKEQMFWVTVWKNHITWDGGSIDMFRPSTHSLLHEMAHVADMIDGQKWKSQTMYEAHGDSFCGWHVELLRRLHPDCALLLGDAYLDAGANVTAPIGGT